MSNDEHLSPLWRELQEENERLREQLQAMGKANESLRTQMQALIEERDLLRDRWRTAVQASARKSGASGVDSAMSSKLRDALRE